MEGNGDRLGRLVIYLLNDIATTLRKTHKLKAYELKEMERARDEN